MVRNGNRIKSGIKDSLLPVDFGNGDKNLVLSRLEIKKALHC